MAAFFKEMKRRIPRNLIVCIQEELQRLHTVCISQTLTFVVGQMDVIPIFYVVLIIIFY
jgi:hypothetical protein